MESTTRNSIFVESQSGLAIRIGHFVLHNMEYMYGFETYTGKNSNKEKHFSVGDVVKSVHLRKKSEALHRKFCFNLYVSYNINL